MKNLKIIILFVLLLIIQPFAVKSILAVKANPNPVEVTQPDGSKLTILLKGDEFIHWAVTTDGYTVLSAASHAYEYAIRTSNGKLTFSGIPAHNPGSRGQNETSFLQTQAKGLYFSTAQINEMKAMLKASKAPAMPASGGFPTTGVRAHLLILANFNNTTTTYTQTNFDNLMNQVNYNSSGSFRDYYLEVSWGQLTVNSTVTVWVTLPHPHDYYGPDDKWGVFAHDAVVAADQQAGVNYAMFDNDSDGVVDGVCIAHQGRGQEESGNTNDIWSHSWDLMEAGFTVAQRTFDGVQVLDYTTIPEKGSPSAFTTIGVMCHEFGHNLGAPDFYDSDYNTSGQYDGTGEWDLMANGSWNGSPAGSRPAHHNPWTKIFYNWVTPTVLSTQQTVLVRNILTYQDVFQYNTTTSNEYFLFENRQQTGFNTPLPGHGLIIYHVDGSYIASHNASNDINNGSHQGLYPMSATSTSGNGIMLSSGSTINTAGCPWPGSSNKTTFTDATTPYSKSWAGANTAKPLINISENTATKEVTLCFISCASPNDPGSFTASAVSTSQINLAWLLNPSSNPVLVAYNTTGTFGTPVSGTTYASGNPIPGGGTVIFNGSGTSFNHPGLTPGTTYYYKAWSVLAGNTYTTGVTANATTFCLASSLPFSESFSGTSIPTCWSQNDIQGNGQVWQFGVITGQTPAPALTGNYAYLNSRGYGTGNTQNANLISPVIDGTGYTNITLTFNHYFRSSSGSSGTVSYSIDNGTTWAVIQTFTTTSATNPAAFSQAIPALDGHSAIQIKWNFTGTYGRYWGIDDVSLTGTPSGPTLIVTPPNQNVTSPAGSTQFTVTTPVAWTTVSDQAWCTVTPSGTGNGTITATYAENTSTVSRVANITTTATGLTPVITTVTQAGVSPTLVVTPPNQNVTASSGSAVFNVTSNSSWSVASNQSWCTVTPSGTGNGTITATYAENTSTVSRVANITTTATGLNPVITTVTQAGVSPTLVVTPPNQTVTPAAGSIQFTVSSNADWVVVSDQLWCTVNNSGSGNGTINAVYAANSGSAPRVATITVSVTGLPPVQVTVNQDWNVGQEEADDDLVTILPNPAKDIVQINFGKFGDKPARIILYNTAGKTILSREISGKKSYNLDIGYLPRGIYTVVISDNFHKVIRKLILR